MKKLAPGLWLVLAAAFGLWLGRASKHAPPPRTVRETVVDTVAPVALLERVRGLEDERHGLHAHCGREGARQFHRPELGPAQLPAAQATAPVVAVLEMTWLPKALGALLLELKEELS